MQAALHQLSLSDSRCPFLLLPGANLLYSLFYSLFFSFHHPQKAGHGRLSNGWVIDAALHHWHEGLPLFRSGALRLTGDLSGPYSGWVVNWGNVKWRVLECSVDASRLAAMMGCQVGLSKL